MNIQSKAQLRVFLINLIVVFVLAGCAVKKLELTESGFLSGYTGMVEDEEVKGLMVYKNSEVNIAERYSKILVAPVKFELDPTVKAHELSFEDRMKLSDYYHEQLNEKLLEHYDLAEEPGADVLLLRSAITDILPNKVYLNLHWSTTLYGAGIGGASIEVELVDSVTNERMLAFVDARKGQKLKMISGLSKWGHTQAVLELWTGVIVDNLNELREHYATDKLSSTTGSEL